MITLGIAAIDVCALFVLVGGSLFHASSLIAQHCRLLLSTNCWKSSCSVDPLAFKWSGSDHKDVMMERLHVTCPSLLVDSTRTVINPCGSCL